MCNVCVCTDVHEGTATCFLTSTLCLSLPWIVPPLNMSSGMSLFAWSHANRNNASLRRADFVAAGSLGVLTALTGVLYLLDFFWVTYWKAVLGPTAENQSSWICMVKSEKIERVYHFHMIILTMHQGCDSFALLTILSSCLQVRLS